MRVRHSSVLSHRGVALVITLILLSVILVVTFALLAISRRERSSVATAQNIIDAEYMANAAMERAKATLAVQIISRTNMAGGGMGGPVFFPAVGPQRSPERSGPDSLSGRPGRTPGLPCLRPPCWCG